MTIADRYVVIGNPIAHSKSPQIHARFAAQTSQAISYEKLLAPLDDFARKVREFMESGGRGANVTVPFKLEAFRLADQLSSRAQAAGAVNTLSFEAGRIIGDNTDGVGLVHDIVSNAGVSITGRQVLLMGAGGAACGVVQPLLAESPASLVIANRTPERAIALACEFAASADVAIRGSDFDSLTDPFDIIINATSASLTAELPSIPDKVLSKASFVYDMMYAATPTPFLQLASDQGAATRDGLGMLVEQAAESFFIWRGVRPQTAPVYEWLRSQL